MADKKIALSSEELKELQFSSFLLDVTNDIIETKNVDEALKTLVQRTIDIVGADRGVIFLHDSSTDELYSYVGEGKLRHEIRFSSSQGIAGWVFNTKEDIITNDPYSHEHFLKSVDQETGYKTKSLICTPLMTTQGKIIGVTQILNKLKGKFSKDDLATLKEMSHQAAIVLMNSLLIEKISKSNEQSLELISTISTISSELQINILLNKVIHIISKMLDAERATLFLHDEKNNELYTEIGEGLKEGERIHFPDHAGIAGTVYQSGKPINIPYAYADLRFNPAFDRKTGFFTRSILCAPVINKEGKVIGVTQVLNKRGRPFDSDDELRLIAFTSQISMCIENATLFDDVQKIKNYNESILESMSSGVITIDSEGVISTCNTAGLKILNVESEKQIIGKSIQDFFTGENEWLVKKIEDVNSGDTLDVNLLDMKMTVNDESLSVNVNILSLQSTNQERIGAVIMIEDISSEKRMKSTMSRYMDVELADKILSGDPDILEGVSKKASVLFSDIANFTTITEELGPEGTVSMLNEYFTIMIDCIQKQEGMLDKFIGDAIMAAFGVPYPHEDDEDRALRAAISMMNELRNFNRQRKEKGQIPIYHRIGINSDNVVSGNIGSPKRMDYTIIGDGVNLAARLESACKQYGAWVLISEYTYNCLKGTYRTRELDKVIVKGKTKPVSVYEVVDFMTEEEFPNKVDVLGHFADGMEMYKKGEWDKAIKSFKEALEVFPEDEPSKLYIERCKALKKNPPKDWDGVWVMKTK